MKKVVNIIISLAVSGSLLLTGCGSKQASTEKNGEKVTNSVNSAVKENKSCYPLTIKDDCDRTVELKEKPKRIAVLSGTFMGIHYATGGTAIARSDAKGGSPMPEEAKNIEVVGQVYNIDMEKLMATKPDFIIGQVGMHDKFIKNFEAAKIPCIMLKMKTYEDVIDKINLLGQINDNVEKSKELLKSMEDKKNGIVNKLPKKDTKVAILYVSSKDVALKAESSIAGNVASILKLKNLTAGIKSEKMGEENIPFSMEKIVENDPDVILVTTMVSSKEEAEKKVKKDLENNPAWNGLRAVKEKKVYYLPQEMFLYNRGEKFADSIEYMAKVVYPDVYGKVE